MDELKKRVTTLEAQVAALTKILKAPVEPEESAPRPEMDSSMDLLEKMQRRKEELLKNKTVNLSLEEKRNKLKKWASEGKQQTTDE